MNFTVTLQDILAIVAVVFGSGTVGVGVLKQKGLITFGRPVERRQYPEGLTYEVNRLVKEVEELKHLVNGINIELTTHLGFHRGRENA